MTQHSYSLPPGGLPPQSQITADRAIFTDAYAVIPRGVMRDIVTSSFPGWKDTRGWVLARPLSGFAETFSQTIMEVMPGGGSDQPEPEPWAEAVLFVVDGTPTITIGRQATDLTAGSYVYLPPGASWTLHNRSETKTTFHWIRKKYQTVASVAPPEPLISHDKDVAPIPMPDTGGAWATTRFVDPGDLAHDMHVNIVTYQPGGSIPFAETHVMEHGIYILQGKGVYRLNQDWVEVEAGDFLWLRAFCPQACYAGGPEPFRYLLYKDVNRHPRLEI